MSGSTVENKFYLPSSSKFMVGEVIQPKITVASTPGEVSYFGKSTDLSLYEIEGEPTSKSLIRRMTGNFYEARLDNATVVRELEPWEYFGPNGKAVVAVIDFWNRVTIDEINRLAQTKRIHAVVPKTIYNRVTNAAGDILLQQSARTLNEIFGNDVEMPKEMDSSDWKEAEELVIRTARAILVYRHLPTRDFEKMTNPFIRTVGTIQEDPLIKYLSFSVRPTKRANPEKASQISGGMGRPRNIDRPEVQPKLPKVVKGALPKHVSEFSRPTNSRPPNEEPIEINEGGRVTDEEGKIGTVLKEYEKGGSTWVDIQFGPVRRSLLKENAEKNFDLAPGEE